MKLDRPTLDYEELKWFAANATELNRLFQRAIRQTGQARLQKGDGEYLDSLDQELERGLRISEAIFDRITRRSHRASASGGAPPNDAGYKPSPSSRSIFSTSAAEMIPLGEIALGDLESDSLILNPKGERELILLVDDDLELLECTGEILDFEDYRIITAKDGIDAVRIYLRMQKEIDLVLLDYFLPVMDGSEVFDELKAINPNVRVVLSSGFAEQAKVSSMLARGLCGFIPKPYTHEKLIEQIRSVLDA
jgi:CheY-like chemotaxis protein